MDHEFFDQVKDEDVPRMLFLSVNPTKIEDIQLEEAAATPTNTDGSGSVGLGFMGIPTEMETESSNRLFSKFEASLEEQSIIPLRRELKLRLLQLSTMESREEESLSTLESNFLDNHDELSENEEDLLRFTEILERLKYPVPDDIRTRFDTIVKVKKIPLRTTPGSDRKKTFFVYAENKILMKVCMDLKSMEVSLIYKILSELKEKDAVIEKLAKKCPPPEALEEVEGLKEVAFYYLILSLMRKKLMNRLYTHKLHFLFEQLMEIHKRNKVDVTHIERTLRTLARYPIASHPPGLCLVFHMTEDRKGEDKDLTRVKDLFIKELQYDVFVIKDPTAKNIKSIICKLGAARNKFYDSLVVWFMGHGTKSYLNVKGGQIHRRVDLIEPFTEIEWFYKKPKLFFIQACAVKENRKRFSSTAQELKAMPTQTDSTVGWKAPASEMWQDKYASFTDVSNVNCFADTLISYATMWYQAAARDEEGSLYVHTLVDQLQEYGSVESIENVLRRVHYNVNTVCLREDVPGQGEVMWKQAPYFESSLQKEFIFPKTKKEVMENVMVEEMDALKTE